MATAKRPEGPRWQNRLVAHAEVDPLTLVANPKNYRAHPENQQAALEGALTELGWLDSVLVNQRSGLIVDGHLRVALALRHRQATVPVSYVDLDETEEALALATFDPAGSLAESDAPALDALLRALDTGNAALQTLFSDLAADAGLYTAPTLDELKALVGDPDLTTFWPVIRVSVTASVAEQFERLLAETPGETADDKLSALLDRVGA